ncbi:hypothetical protein Tco_1343649 [Tanacetum coccineum]
MLVLIVDQSFIYGVSDDVDTTYSSKFMMFGIHRLESVNKGKASHVNELQMQGVSNPQLLRKSIKRSVGIKNLLNAASITASLIDVNVAQSKLYKVNVAEGVNAASEEVSIVELVSTAYVIYLVSSTRKSTSSVKINLNKFKLSDEDVKFRFSSASSHADNGSNNSSSPKPSRTPENLVTLARKSTSSEKINQNKFKLSDKDVKPQLSSASSRGSNNSNESVSSEPYDF